MEMCSGVFVSGTTDFMLMSRQQVCLCVVCVLCVLTILAWLAHLVVLRRELSSCDTSEWIMYTNFIATEGRARRGERGEGRCERGEGEKDGARKGGGREGE